MNATYTLTEGNDALNRVLLMMRYDMGKTLDEQKIPTDKDLKKFKDNEYYNNTQKFVDNTGVTYTDFSGKQKTSGTSPEGRIQRFEAPTLSEAILKLREFFYDPIGITTQVVLSVVGAEIGMPVFFQILDGAIIVNDVYIMVRDWDNNGPKISYESGQLWKWFEFHFKNNIGFQYLCVDILAIVAGFGIMGIGKIATKSVKSIFKLLIQKFGKSFPVKIAEFLSKLKPKTDKMPKEIGSWVDKKMSEINKAIDLLKTPKEAGRSVVKQIPKATFAGGIAYALGKYLEVKIPKWTGTDNEAKYTYYILIDNPSIYNKPMKYQEKGPFGEIYNYLKNKYGDFYVYDEPSKKYIKVTKPNEVKSLNNMFIKNVYPKIKFDDFEVNNSDKENPVYTINGSDYEQVNDSSFKLRKIK